MINFGEFYYRLLFIWWLIYFIFNLLLCSRYLSCCYLSHCLYYQDFISCCCCCHRFDQPNDSLFLNYLSFLKQQLAFHFYRCYRFHLCRHRYHHLCCRSSSSLPSTTRSSSYRSTCCFPSTYHHFLPSLFLPPRTQSIPTWWSSQIPTFSFRWIKWHPWSGCYFYYSEWFLFLGFKLF